MSQVQDDPAVGEAVWEATTHWRHGFQSKAHIRTHSLRSLLDLYGHSTMA